MRHSMRRALRNHGPDPVPPCTTVPAGLAPSHLIVPEGLGAGEALFGAGDHAGDECEGQPNDIEIAPVDAGNPAGGLALDGVGSGFAVRLASGDVAGDVLVGGREEGDVGDLGGDLSVRAGDECDAGDDLMRGSGKKAQHAGGVGVGFGLGQHFAVGGDDGGVGAEDEEGLVWVLGGEGCEGGRGGDGFSFFAGEAEDVRDGLLAGVRILGDVGGEDGEGVSSLGEEIAAARGSRSENKHGEIMAGAGRAELLLDDDQSMESVTLAYLVEYLEDQIAKGVRIR